MVSAWGWGDRGDEGGGARRGKRGGFGKEILVWLHWLSNYSYSKITSKWIINDEMRKTEMMRVYEYKKNDIERNYDRKQINLILWDYESLVRKMRVEADEIK